MNTFDLSLDLDKRAGVTQWVTMRQGDHDGTQLRATIYDHGTQVSDSYTCRVSIRKPTDAEYYRETCSFSGGVAIVTIDEQYAASEVGITYGYFELLQGTAVIASTENFGVRILQSAIDGAIVAPPYDSAIEDALAELDEATGRISQMVVDATAEYLEAHPEITTTVQDNSLDDDKLIQSGGILQREQWLETMLPNIPRKATSEADVHSVTDSAGGGPLGIEVYGRSTQDGTPMPDAPVAIESVEGNILQPPAAASTSGGVTYTPQADGTIAASGTATGNSTLYFVNTPTPIAAGTYWLGGCPSGGTTSTYYLRVAACTESGTTLRRYNDVGAGVEVTINDGEYFTCFFHASSGDAMTGKVIRPMLARGAGPMPYVHYGNVGLYTQRTSDASQTVTIPIDLGGRSLRSLPDGTRDEVVVDEWGHAVLVQRVGLITITQAHAYGAYSYANLGTVGRAVMYVSIADGPAAAPVTNNNGLCTMAPWLNSYTADSIHAYVTNSDSASQVAVFAQGSTAAEVASKYVGAQFIYKRATPQTIDLGYLDPALLPAPDLTAYVVPSAPSVLRYGYAVAESTSSNLAPVETSPATASHAVGTLLTLDGQLVKVTSAIAVGEAVTIGGNVRTTTIAAELAALA